MTDSMKFGPEWLRNMSADTSSSNTINTAGCQLNPAGMFCSENSSSGEGTSANNPNNSNSANMNNLHNNVNAGNSGASRNTFPEFRYGREEMLLLFDRNCAIPEILPSYKNLFVERVQFPLALVPSTDEEMMQPSAPTTQRPGWLQRSPVGFSTANRGTGRVGCMERGRLRGKSVYHPVFQRPTAIFDEDQRTSAIKQTERGWSERNGVAAGDPTISNTTTTVSGSLSGDTWNGNTPMSSPRREFSNHHRNVENWRRSREEGTGSETTTTPSTFSADSGWRLNSSGYQSTHTRWGRSTSWRDDDLLNSNESKGVNSGSVGVSGSNVMMLRSNSTLATTQCERLGNISGSGKQNGAHGGVTRSTSMLTSTSKNTTAGNIWNNGAQSTGQMSNNQGDVSGNDEMALPEWAMENPSDIGGTFDASGAFHGSVDDNENENSNTNEINADFQQDSVSNEKNHTETEVEEPSSKSKSKDEHLNKSFKNNSQDPKLKSPSPKLSPAKNNVNNTTLNDKTDSTKNNNISPTIKEIDRLANTDNDSSSENKQFKESVTNANAQNSSIRENTSANNAGDYTERTMKVTDYMIEKLIMDDEDGKIDQIKTSLLSSDANKGDSQIMFVSSLQQQNTNNASTVSPVMGGVVGPNGPPNMSLYNMSGIMVDHSHNMAALHQLQQQQMAAVTAVAMGLHHTSNTPHPITSSAPTDLWFYRDPQAKVQGPFSALEMTEWYRAGYFNENLFVRRVCDARFIPLGELIKICNGQMPFSHSHMIPIDLNSTALTPPLAPVITATPSAQTNDFVMKALNEHQKHEKLKGNVTAAADSLSNALKNLINSVDISQVLNMHFQTLQDRFIHNQETEIVNELSKNECFRRLAPAEQEALVRQKLQRMVLPEYLTNLTSLSNSLAVLNPTAGTQLYDTIAECIKKEQLFNNHQSASPQATIQQQHSNHHVSSSTPFMDSKDFIMKTKNSGHDINYLLNDFNMRLFLNNGSTDPNAGGTNGIDTATNSHSRDFLNDQQLFGSESTSIQNSTNNTSQSPMMQMWMNSLATTNQSNTLPPQHPIVATSINNQWLNGPLVGIPSININREQHNTGNIIGSPKATNASMWDVATLEQHVHIQQQKHEQQQLKEMQPNNQLFETNNNLKDSEKHLQGDNQQQQQYVNKNENKINQQKSDDQKRDHSVQQNQSNEEQKTHDPAVNDSFTHENNNKQEQRSTEKSQIINSNNCNSTNNNIVAKVLLNKGKAENLVEQVSKKSDEDRRRELNEEKRRQKEERKKLQMEEEKRRLMQLEEEKRRQLEEDEKRQQQIQAHRRKALTSNSNNGNSSSSNSTLTSPNSTSNQGKSKEQLRIQSSVAPWSTQPTSKSQGPGLAEIQKAERRERRADQQRQLEIQEKQMRAVAAAAEAQDTALKWNAAPLPVKSFAEIQAEEAKRLAHEQMELQRRREQESNNLTSFCSGSNNGAGGGNSSSNTSNIWNGNKIWGSSTNTGGFWEEPLKLNNKAATTSSPNVNNVSSNPTTLQTANIQHKTITAHQSNQASSTQQPTTNRNVKKSQTMENTTAPTAPSSLNCQKKTSSSNTITTKSKSQNNESKKSAPKTYNKGDDYEAEFINWCTKSLNNMSTKVDVPTFVSFLRDLESPYEVKDYIRMYLGESKEYIDFAKQFLERRSKYKNLQRAQNAHDDDLCKPAQAITPSVNDNTENKAKQKKVKKNKMTKLDARILGFSVTAAEGRINVGDRDYGDAS